MPSDQKAWQPAPLLIEGFADNTARLVADARKLAVAVPDALALLDRLDHLPPAGALVVVGETKKGKSSIVNALVGRPGLSPVAVDVATATYVWFGYGPDRAFARPAKGRPRQIALDDISRWVSVDGLAANRDAHDDDGGLPAFPLQVELNVDLLRELAILDTPGVGGLVGEHTKRTLDAVSRAGAMLFVTDITTPLTRPEADFLQDVAEHNQIPEVIIVANMSDKLTPTQLAEAMTDLRAKLAERLPRFARCPVVSVSALRAEKAVMQPDLPDAARAVLRATSNFDELLAIVRNRIVSRINILNDARKLNVVQLVGSTVATQTRLTLEAAQPQTSTASTGELEQQLSVLPQVMRSTQLKITNDLGNLQRSLGSFLDTAIRRISSELDHAIQVDTPFATVQASLARSLDTLNTDLTRQTSTGIGQVFRDNINALGVNDETTAALELAMATATASAAASVQLREGSEHYETPMSADSYATASFGAMSGMSLVRTVGGTSVGGGILATLFGGGALEPISLIVGAVTVGMNLHRAKRLTRIGDNKNWLRDRTGTAQSDFSQSISASISQASYLATTALDEFSRTRVTWLRQGIEVAKGSVQIDIGAAKATLGRAEGVVREAGKLLQQAGVLPALPEGP
jgi:GTP-binding protein EngB required for normal cell division